MIENGEALCSRYVVSKGPAHLQEGALLEVVDRGAAVVQAQVLSVFPTPQVDAAMVRNELAVLPALARLVRPRELVLTPRTLPVAILDRAGVVPLRDRVAALAESMGKRPLVVALFRWIAAVATDLDQVHRAGIHHGAITSTVLLHNPRADSEACLLAGYGIGSLARRRDEARPAATARGDLVDLIAALHDLFLAASVQPDGSAQAKWTLLRHSALHGEHPALASGAALAAALNELASLPPDDPSQTPGPRNRTPTLVAARPVSRTRPNVTPVPDGARTSSPPRTSGSTPSRPSSRVPPRPGRFLGRMRFSVRILAAGGLVLTALVAAFTLYIVDARKLGIGHLQGHDARAGRGSLHLACRDESNGPVQSLDFERVPDDFDATCVPGADRLTLVTRAGTTLLAASRPAHRGGHFPPDPVTITQGAVELGTVLSLPDADWVPWRNGVGSPIGLARLDTRAVVAIPFELPGWEIVPLRGLHMLHVTARDAFAVTNVESAGGAHAVLLAIALPPVTNRPAVITWYLGAGTVEAVIPGENPHLLFHLREAMRHQVSVLTLRLPSIAAARTPAEPTSVRGASLPDAAVEHSPPLILPGEVLLAAPRGLAGPRTFLVTTGPARTVEACPAPNRCVGPGAVTLVSFPPGQPPTAREVATNAWGEDVLPSSADTLTVLVMFATVTGSPRALHTVLAVPAEGTPRQSTVPLRGPPRARLLPCAGEEWMAFDIPRAASATPAHALAALPLACLRQP